jgi:hypothetical protein
VFLKIAGTREQLAAEAEALRAFGSHRAVEVHEVRTADLTLVLERAQPGASLASLATEDEAMRVLVGLLTPAWPPLPEDTLAEPLAIFARALGRQPVLGRAAGLLAELSRTRARPRCSMATFITKTSSRPIAPGIC